MPKDDERLFPKERYPGPNLTEEMLTEITEELKPQPPLPPTLLRPTLVQEIKDQKYKNFIVDLNTVHALTPLVQACGGSGGLRSLGIVGDTMTIIRADAAFDYILNAPTNDPTPGAAGMNETEFEIEEIYITNAAMGAGLIAIIRVNYNPFLIRIR